MSTVMNCSISPIILHTHPYSEKIKLTTIKNISKIKLEVSRLPFSSVSKLLIVLSQEFRPENVTLWATWQKKLISQDKCSEMVPK